LTDAKIREHGRDDGHDNLFYHRDLGVGVRVV
jgi:hypothetical protein